ncbi:MAG: hypothetical protein ACKO21_01405 [Nodosilinea sp.]
MPIRIISRIDGKDPGQDGSVMGTLRFAHPTGLLLDSQPANVGGS